MIFTKLLISGNQFEDSKNINVIKSIGDNISTSSFNVEFDSPYGRHKSDFNVGQEVRVYADNIPIHNVGSPFAQWRMNDGTGSLVTDTMGAFNGNLVSGTWGLGKIGSAVYFTGDYTGSGYICVANGSQFTLSGTDFSVFAWVYPSGASRDTHTVFSRYSAVANGREYHFGTGSASGATLPLYLSVYYYPSSGATNINKTVNNILYRNLWNHIGFTQETGSLYKLYVNNSLVGSIINPSGLVTTAGSVYIGAVVNSTTTPDHQFIGMIDDVRVYKKCLSQGEINQIYANGSGTELISDNSQKIFAGAIEQINFNGEENEQYATIEGRDYSQILQDNTVEPVVYTNSEISTIVKDIINNNITGITTNNVNVTTTTLKRIAFNQIPVYDALKQLAELAGYVFYVDENKDLHFEQANSSSSGYTFDNSNITKMNYDTTREGMANKIWVYGDRYLAAAPTEILRVGSPNDGGNLGSSFNLIAKPSNTSVSILGSIRTGGVYQMIISPTSGTVYYVSYDDAQIIFPSGTAFGYYLPPSGGSIVVNYDRTYPIVKYGQNDAAISLYGPKTLVINDKSIKDPNTALSILKQKLSDTDPFRMIELTSKGWLTMNPGQTATVTLSNFNINDSYPLLELNYDFNVENNLAERVQRFRFDKKVSDITDQITNLKKRLDALEAQDRLESDTITRLIQTNGSLTVVGSYWEVRTRSIAGDTLIYDSPTFGIYDTNKYGGSPFQVSFVLGRNLSAVLGTGQLGQNLSTWQTIRSGGYSYT